jgi:hypothetical protein
MRSWTDCEACPVGTSNLSERKVGSMQLTHSVHSMAAFKNIRFRRIHWQQPHFHIGPFYYLLRQVTLAIVAGSCCVLLQLTVMTCDHLASGDTPEDFPESLHRWVTASGRVRGNSRRLAIGSLPGSSRLGYQ